MKAKSLLILSAALFIGCNASIPVKKESANLNLDYKFSEQQQKNHKLIAITQPVFDKNFTGDKNRLTSAFNDSLYELFSKKGFNTRGPLAGLNDLTYSDKKTVYLVSAPKLSMQLQNNATTPNCETFHCTQTGNVGVTGSFTLHMIEPLSNETILSKRINLSDFNIAVPYTRQWEKSTPRSESAILTLVKQAQAATSKPSELVDNYHKAEAEALNEFYGKTMEKLESYISTRELLNMNGDITDLKSRKRY